MEQRTTERTERKAVHPTNRERRRRDRRIWRAAFLASALFHVLIFLLGPRASMPDSPFAAAGPRAMDDQAAPGMMQALSMSAAPPDAAIPPPTPVPDIEPPPIEDLEIEVDALPEVDFEEVEVPLPGVGRTVGDDDADEADAGVPEATGQGDGGTHDEGLFRVIAPVARGMIVDFPHTSDVSGEEVEIWVFVNETGRVVPDSTRLDPPTSSRRVNEGIVDRANRWTFRPARQGEEAVASWWSFRLSF